MRTEYKLVLAIAALASIGIVRLAIGQPILPTVLTPASTATGAGFNIPPGTAPSSPNAGDCWTTSAGAFDCRLNGATVNLAAGSTGATSVSNSDGTLTISPTTGAVVASIALGHANTWSGVQTFNSGDLVASNITNTGVLTLPTSTDTLVGRATTDTLTSKTIAFGSNTLTGVAPLASPTFTGTVTFPDAATWSASGLLSGTSLVVGSASAQNFNGANTAKIETLGATNAAAQIGIGEWSNDGSIPSINLLKSRGASIGTMAAVQSGDNLGVIRGLGDDGSTAGGIEGAQITFAADANFSAGSGSSRIGLWTRSGAGAVTEQLRIDHVGQVFVNGGATVIANQNGQLFGTGIAAGYGAIITGSASGQALGLEIKAGSGAGDVPLAVQTATAGNLLVVFGDGGAVLGAATGGSKGAGTLNVASNIYLNGTAYTNPDYVLEMAATGQIVKFAGNAGAKGYQGLMPLDDAIAFTKANYVLPEIARARAKGGSLGLFDGGDAVLASVEQNFLYVAQLNEKIKSQEDEIGELKQKLLVDESTIENLIGEYQRLDGWLSQSTDSKTQLKPER